MRPIDLLNLLTESAKLYRVGAMGSIERNNHMNKVEDGEFIPQKYIDAVLVDFINRIAENHGIDYALYTKDL